MLSPAGTQKKGDDAEIIGSNFTEYLFAESLLTDIFI